MTEAILCQPSWSRNVFVPKFDTVAFRAQSNIIKPFITHVRPVEAWVSVKNILAEPNLLSKRFFLGVPKIRKSGRRQRQNTLCSVSIYLSYSLGVLELHCFLAQNTRCARSYQLLSTLKRTTLLLIPNTVGDNCYRRARRHESIHHHIARSAWLYSLEVHIVLVWVWYVLPRSVATASVSLSNHFISSYFCWLLELLLDLKQYVFLRGSAALLP